MTPHGDDLDRLMAVMQAGFDPAYGEAWNRRQVEDALLLGQCSYGLAAAHGGEPAPGEAAAGFYLSRHGYEEAELLLIAVDPAQRGKGIGGALLTRFAAEARERGAQRLLLEMRRGNPAETLYRRFGFEQIGQRPNYYRTPDGSRIDAVTFACICP
ncbi:GNAT family N-acetyltransferase [Novosphingobium sp.]|jgi:ribosomal-protein-alanine N-acetyltransferase|uniref:GNAT family N-acetyltransferase n=1 Tax=Novosphingobium sp. TaxID=1874826 RepID=UPI001EC4B9D5|nr:GNAT family N-acetyltransferase [Novosphingobium sp.]MBK6800807.1 GNAT family N-acetyltransferase [Novosphingobium sp.]MBK9011365.1 GNAT family N-acetyltransferase [Novosphingobium sp.]